MLECQALFSVNIRFLFLTSGLVRAKLQMCPSISYTYRIEILAGIQQHHDRRKIVFLTSVDRRVTAKPVFDSFIGTDVERAFKTRFDAWIDNQPPKPHRYHGWNKSEFGGRYSRCFVFKNPPHRLYGFLCHPKKTDRRFEACVLVKHAEKRRDETDEMELKTVEEIRNMLVVEKALEAFLWE